MSEEGKEENPPKYTVKTVEDAIGLADSVQTISTITGSLAEGYNRLSGTFSPQQKSIADTIRFEKGLEDITSIAENQKKLVKLTEQDAQNRKWQSYISAVIAIIAIIVAIIAWVFPRKA